MDKDRVTEFYDKLCKLEEEYGIYIAADYNEDWDYAWDGENEYPTLAYVNPYIALVDSNNNEVGKIHNGYGFEESKENLINQMNHYAW